jgi:hypothetical protein
MAELSPKERVMRLLRKEPVDTMPFFSGMGMVVMPGIEKAGVNFPTIHTDPERMAMSAIWSARLMGFDCVVIPYDMTMESEAVGNTISLYEDSEDILYPTIPNKIWSTLDEVEIPDNITEIGRGRRDLVIGWIRLESTPARCWFHLFYCHICLTNALDALAHDPDLVIIHLQRNRCVHPASALQWLFSSVSSCRWFCPVARFCRGRAWCVLWRHGH